MLSVFFCTHFMLPYSAELKEQLTKSLSKNLEIWLVGQEHWLKVIKKSGKQFLGFNQAIFQPTKFLAGQKHLKVFATLS